MAKTNMRHFEGVLRYTRQYFIFEYKAGTREMVRRYVTAHVDASPAEISAALQILKMENGILWEKNVWWNIGVR